METMERRAQERQLDLLMPVDDEATTPLFDAATRAEIVNLLEVLLSDRLAAIRTPAETDNE